MKKLFIQTYTGRAVDPLNLQIEDIDLHDIAHSLSLQCRYTGHSKFHYSVGQHCVLLAEYALKNISPDAAYEVLHHDDTEAYMVDLANPLKVREEFAFFRVAEDRAFKVIAQKFGLEDPMSELTHHLDKSIFMDEFPQVMITGEKKITGKQPLGIKIEEMNWRDVEKRFIELHHELSWLKKRVSE